jgi:hypothetical protein
MDRKLQDHLLAPLASIVRMGQKVSFIGDVCNSQQIECLKKVMGPRLICANALFWSARVECEQAKEVADATVEHDELDFLLDMYMSLINRLSTRMGALTRNDCAQFMRVSPFVEMINAMDTFRIELLQIHACGDVKQGQIGYFMQTCDRLQEVLNATSRTPKEGLFGSMTIQQLDRHYSILMYQHLYGPHRDYNPIPRGGSLAQQTNVFDIDHMVQSNRNEMIRLGPHLAYDHAILALHPDREAVLTAEHLPLDQCAAAVFPCIPTAYYKTVEGEMEQRHYHGLQDLGFLRSFSIDVQNQIHEEQEKYGLEKTDFSQL